MANDMPEWQKQCFDHFMRHYKQNWDLNQYYRDGHDEDLEYYLGYRDQTKYPLAYSISFNKLLPRVMQVMSRFMDQLYQPNSNELVGVRPRKRSDVDRVQRVQGLLNFQLETLNDIDTIGGSYYFNFQWMLNATAFGKGIAKLVWRKEERIGPTRIQIPVPKMDRAGNVMGLDMKDLLVEMPQVIYDGPYAEVIHNKNFVPHPHYRDIQKMPAVFCVYKRSIDYLKQMADKGVYGNIQNLGWGSSGAGSDTYEAISKSLDIEGAITSQQLESGRITPEVDVIEGYGRYIFPEDEIPYEVGSGMVIKGKESEAIVHIGNYKTILQVQKNEYGVRPFFDIGAYMHPELYWDLGLIKLGKEIQEQYNNLGNLRFQNAMMSVNQMLKVRQDADIDPRALIWKPFGIIPVEDMGDVEPMQTLDIASSGTFREQSQFFEDVLSDMTGMYQYGLGGTPPRQEHVGCFYEQLEILTDQGWKTYNQLSRKERVMTLDHETEKMTWQRPTSYFDKEVKDYPAYEYDNEHIQFTVTENHRFPVVSRPRDGSKRVIKMVQEFGPGTDFRLPLTGEWFGKKQEFKEFAGFKIPMADWCAFLGLFLSEGYAGFGRQKVTNGARYRIIIKQCKEEGKILVRELFKKLPFNVSESADGGFEINSKALYLELEPLGKAHTKYIPAEIKNLHRDYLNVLIDWLIMGDGTIIKERIHKDGHVREEYREYYTVSKQLADDFQEIVLKTGFTGRVTIKKNSESSYKKSTVLYKVSIRKGKYTKLKKFKPLKKSGRVWCLSVPNGIFLVRSADGMPFWTGNTIYSLQNVGEARVRLMLMTMDYQGFRPFLKHMMLLNTYHLDPEFEARIMDRQGPTFEPLFPGDLHPDYDFTVRYTAMEPALGKQFRAQQLIQYAQMWQATPYLQQYEFMKAILEMMDFQDSDRYLKSPEQIQQEQVQQAQMMQEQQMQAMMAQMQMQDTLATKQHERKVQGDLLLEQTKQQGEVVKELMK